MSTPAFRLFRAGAAACLCGALAASGCADPAVTVVFVNVESRPAVRSAATMAVTVSNAGSDLTETFNIEDVAFPTSFTVTPTGREGDLSVSIRATDEDDLEIATGAGSATIAADAQVDLDLILEPSDFVVNSSIAGDQSLTFAIDRNSRQIGVAFDDSFVLSFVNDCQNLGRCDVLGRMFDATSTPVVNDKTRDTNDYIVNQDNQISEIPSVVIASDGTQLFTWTAEDEIRSALMSETGGHLLDADIQVSASPEVSSDPRAVALPTGEFIVVWTEDLGDGTLSLRGRFLDSAGAPALNPVTNNTDPFDITAQPANFLELPSVAATGNGRSFVVVWTDLDNVRARFFDNLGAPISDDLTLTPFGVNVLVLAPQVVSLGNDEIGVAWESLTIGEPPFEDGAITYQRFKVESGSPLGELVSVVPKVDVLTRAFNGAPGLALRPDGALAVSWHDCPEFDGGPDIDGSGCSILMQVFRASGLRVGDPIIAPTTRAGDQLLSAIAARSDAFIVAWTDISTAPPDTDGGSVRARVIYPPFDQPDGKIGQPCGATDDVECGAGLACIDDANGESLCHESCDPNDANPCPNGGTCFLQAGVGACVL